MKQTLYPLTTNGNNLRIELVIMEKKNDMHWLAGTQLHIN